MTQCVIQELNMLQLKMRNIKLTKMLQEHICKWKFQILATRAAHTEVCSRTLRDSGSSLTALLEGKLQEALPRPNTICASIYKVPSHLRSVETEAYEPNIISIGPYHHQAPRLQAMEEIKWNFFHRLFHPSRQRRPNLEKLINELKKIEHDARSCYSEDLEVSSEKFINIMLIDSCFIVELLRELKKKDSTNGSAFIKRWMLPVLCRDMIMLENQIPLIVLSKVFNSTNVVDCENTIPSLKELALEFFEPLIYKDSMLGRITSPTAGDGGNHFLDLFRASILPDQLSRGKEPHMYRSMAELKESGVKLKKAEFSLPLEISFKKGILRIPTLCLDDYRFTLFRNMVAFEQCHFPCAPDVTAYIFFLDRLINSANDIELLHYAGVIQHSLGGNKQVARLVNKLCKEVAGDVNESYLHEIVWKINCYCNDGLNVKKARLKHEYFYNIWVSLSTIAAIILLYLTVLQTSYGLGDKEARVHLEKTGFWVSVVESFAIPFTGVRQHAKPFMVEDESHPYDHILRFFGLSLLDDTQSIFFISC